MTCATGVCRTGRLPFRPSDDVSVDLILLRAIQLIARPQRFTINAHAVNAAGEAVRSLDPNAVAFSVIGALRRASHDIMDGSEDYKKSYWPEIMWEAIERVKFSLPSYFGLNLEAFALVTSHETALDVLRQARVDRRFDDARQTT